MFLALLHYVRSARLLPKAAQTHQNRYNLTFAEDELLQDQSVPFGFALAFHLGCPPLRLPPSYME